MPAEKPVIVLTTIHSPKHPVLGRICEQAHVRNAELIIVGDLKTPDDFNNTNCTFLSVKDQAKMEYELQTLLPFNHYSRKNLGYLAAIKKGAGQIAELDDDNEPLPSFWRPRNIRLSGNVAGAEWVNAYRYFADTEAWPRGYPLGLIEKENDIKLTQHSECLSPIQQGLSDKEPDLDAVYRLYSQAPITFKEMAPLFLQADSVCPFNSQNTLWFAPAFPLLYLPSTCGMRVCDIWRGYVAQRIMWENGWQLSFHNADVKQSRNVHDLFEDMRQEIPAYLNAEKLVNDLKALRLKRGAENIPYNLEACYEVLIGRGLVEKEEMVLLRAWTADIKRLSMAPFS